MKMSYLSTLRENLNCPSWPHADLPYLLTCDQQRHIYYMMQYITSEHCLQHVLSLLLCKNVHPFLTFSQDKKSS